MAYHIRNARALQVNTRCIVISLTFTFIAFNLLVFHTFSGNNPTIVIYPSEAYTAEDSDLRSPSTQNTWAAPVSSQGSFQSDPSWIGHWFRWRGLDPGEDDRIEPRRFDVVYTWVNGSDPDLQTVRMRAQEQSPLFQSLNTGDSKSAEAITAKRFRDMDELRYSVRSIAENAKDMYQRIHLLVTETINGEVQVPGWLAQQNTENSDVFQVVRHRTFFQNSSYLPSFNSLAIESQMLNIPGITDIFMYLNDDFFVGATIVPSDINTPLYGFVFHMEGSLLVPPTIRQKEANPINIGEWHSLQYANYLLSGRFGPRFRPYLAHVPHVFSVSMLKEMQELWPDAFDSTGSHRFRGEGEAKDVQAAFFMAHYVAEKLRETQLESYWHHRVDRNGDKLLDWSERVELVNLIRTWNQNQQLEESQRVRHSRPVMHDGYERILKRVGIAVSGSTAYRQSGLDGYPFLQRHSDTSKTVPLAPFKDASGVEQKPQVPYMSYEPPHKRTCQLDISFCLGASFSDPTQPLLMDSQAIFDRMAFKEIHCGDCLLEILMQHPNAGIGYILPENEDSAEFKEVVRKIFRYNYVLGTSDYSFMSLHNPKEGQKRLDDLLDAKLRKVFFCINDDYSGDDSKVQSELQNIFGSFLDERFPNPSPWEK
ncbi:hypothetical protein BGW38_008018 [Lunasporangiospora selenospora]|uniref:Stealth protein CR1 conserved region 1 domain-containing protein n=1 Tax=Lunasporangiospora selenospora TaxID=979761 RepID=A0A9P6G4U4_9FUNG|nr:hypothetical protein BGW38_008018 [Lunasporangiospora selenospora]